MDEKLIQFSRGDFEASQAGLRLSDPDLIFSVEEGKTFKGSFYIGSETGTPMQGVLYSECPYISLARENLDAKELSIEYTFSAKELRAGETVNSCISIITNCGEAELPLIVSIDNPSVDYEKGRVSDLAGFAVVARDNYKEALEIFRSDEFSHIFLFRDIENIILYRTLTKSSQWSHAMEEFLVATRKKNRITLIVDRNNLRYENCQDVIKDKIKIMRSTWGNEEIIVKSTAAYIIPAHKRIWTDRFDDGSYVLEFDIDSGKMRQGVNSGSIILETMYQNIEINITCTLKKEEKEAYIKSDMFRAKVMRSFIEFRNNHIKKEEFCRIIDDLTVQYRGFCEDISDLCLAYTAIIASSESMDEYMNTLRPRKPDDNIPSVDNIMVYCIYQYIYAMYYMAKNNGEEAGKYIAELRNIYDNDNDYWFVFCLLLKLEPELKNNRSTFCNIAGYIKNGCTSPILYSEFCEMVREDSRLIGEWDDSMIRPFAWGAGRGLISEEAASVYGYYVSRNKKFDNLVFHSLEHLYEKYGSDELLQIICRMLIKAGRIDDTALSWYEKGIERQLRITLLYENYMRSLKDSDTRLIPHAVLMYFVYDNRLPDREKSILFASVIRGKNIDPSAYKAYGIMISNFARSQLEAGNINGNLAIIYEDSIRMDSIDESMAMALPKVMFRNEIVCNNPMAEAVCVVHKEIDDEQIVPFADGIAYVDIYSQDAGVFIIDKRGNRYYGSEDYTIRPLLHPELYAELCFEQNQEDKGLLLHMFIKSYKDYKSSEDNIHIRRLADKRLNLSDYYKKNNLSALVFYYYEHANGERLDEILENVNLENVGRNTRNKWIELFILRGMNLKALKALKDYGYDNVDMARIGKLCRELLSKDSAELISDGVNLGEMLITLEYEIFARGGYTNDIIAHLVKEYNGSSDNMITIWDTAVKLRIDCTELEGRLLERIMMVEDNAYKGIDILCNYLESGKDETLKKAYVSYLCYEYIRDGIADSQDSTVCIPNQIWDFIRNNVMTEYNKVCLLAVLKNYSMRELNDDETAFCEIRLAELHKSGIIMGFFSNFKDKPVTYAGAAEREILQCNARPGISLKLQCINEDGSIQIIKVPEVYCGIYVTELVVFEGETVSYDFFEEKGNARISHGSGKVTCHRNNKKESGRIGLINDMINARDSKEYNVLCKKMEEYIEIDETSKDLFMIL